MENEQNKPMQTPAPYAAGTGSVPVALDRDAFARMGYRERLALKKENPEVRGGILAPSQREARKQPNPTKQTDKGATNGNRRAGHTAPTVQK